MKRRFSIRVSGKVQGVFFRVSTKEAADQLGVSGFVKNEPNGDVYIEAEADEDVLKRFIEWCHQGPPRARVTLVDTTEIHVLEATHFEITR